MTKRSDDQILQACFYLILQKSANFRACTTSDLLALNKNGFDLPIEEEYVSEFMHELANRCGYRLDNDEMWQDNPQISE